jgi:hypothetical protein
MPRIDVTDEELLCIRRALRTQKRTLNEILEITAPSPLALSTESFRILTGEIAMCQKLLDELQGE